jgi:hypothetical protein
MVWYGACIIVGLKTLLMVEKRMKEMSAKEKRKEGKKINRLL